MRKFREKMGEKNAKILRKKIRKLYENFATKNFANSLERNKHHWSFIKYPLLSEAPTVIYLETPNFFKEPLIYF